MIDCRVVEPDQWCRRCDAEGVLRDTETRRLAHEPFGHRPTTLLVRVRRYQCDHCRRTWRQDMSNAAAPRTKIYIPRLGPFPKATRPSKRPGHLSTHRHRLPRTRQEATQTNGDLDRVPKANSVVVEEIRPCGSLRPAPCPNPSVQHAIRCPDRRAFPAPGRTGDLPPYVFQVDKGVWPGRIGTSFRTWAVPVDDRTTRHARYTVG